MIVTTSAQHSRHLIPNMFDPQHYYRLDVRLGVMRNRQGAKCITISGFLAKGIHRALKDEAGPAWRLVLRRCGEFWGSRFADRFLKEISEFYGQALDTMPMARLHALICEQFALMGWGRPRIDYGWLGNGLLEIEIEHPFFGEILKGQDQMVEVIMEGVFKELFAKLSGQPLDCHQTRCVAAGARSSLFIVGLDSRLAKVPEMVEQGKGHQEIIEKIAAEAGA